jgi:hypothetical protein
MSTSTSYVDLKALREEMPLDAYYDKDGDAWTQGMTIEMELQVKQSCAANMFCSAMRYHLGEKKLSLKGQYRKDGVLLSTKIPNLKFSHQTTMENVILNIKI